MIYLGYAISTASWLGGATFLFAYGHPVAGSFCIFFAACVKVSRDADSAKAGT